MKTIAIDIDDTLNNFSEVLRDIEIDYANFRYIDKPTFDTWLKAVKENSFNEELVKIQEFNSFYAHVHKQCYPLAKAKTDAAKFVQWLKANNWRIVILTYRDLRGIANNTKKWLIDNQIPFDYLFSADNKVLFCKIWDIKYLIDDSLFNIINAPLNNINMYYPITKDTVGIDNNAVGFFNFDELYKEFEVLK